MKILILIQRWEGGVGRYVSEIKKELEKRKNKVKVISREDDLKETSFLKSILKLRKISKSEKYDLIYSQDWNTTLPLLGMKNHYACFHGTHPKGVSKIIQKITGILMGKRLIVVGNTLKKMFPKSNLNYEGVNTNLFKPLKIKKIKNSVGFVNWKTEQYNYPEIKKAVGKEGKRLLIAGNVPKEKMPEFYNKIEMFISLPPSYAGFNLSWLEAMACRVPKIIGNKYGVGAELLITHVEDFGSIEEAIKNAKRRNYRTESMKFSWKTHVNKLLDIFEK